MRSIESGQLILFLQQLNLLLEAGVALERSFRSIGRDANSKIFAAFATKVAEEQEKGSTLPEILDNEERFFNTFDKTLIKSCWRTGRLSEGFSQLYDHHKKRLDLSEQMKGVFIYKIMLYINTLYITLISYLYTYFYTLF